MKTVKQFLFLYAETEKGGNIRAIRGGSEIDPLAICHEIGTFSRNLKWFTTAVQLSGNFSGMIELLAAVFFFVLLYYNQK